MTRAIQPTLKITSMTAVAAAVLALGGCGGGNSGSGGSFEAKNVKPTYLGTVVTANYDGNSDDLLTAGLGKTGLGGAAPVAANPLSPTGAELRDRKSVV